MGWRFCWAPAGLVLVSSAQATQYVYSCEHCAEKNGVEAGGLDEEEGLNLSGSGVCSAFWQYYSGSWHETAKCNGTLTEECVWQASGTTGHGQVRRWYAKYTYTLTGRETTAGERCVR